MRALLRAATRKERRDDPEVEVEAPRRPKVDPGKLCAGDVAEHPHLGHANAAPGKLTLDDVGRDRMSPPSALGYAELISRPHVARSAEPGGDVLEDAGTLASAFAFIDASQGGRPLPPALLARLTAELGVDLSAMRVHTDGPAARAAAALQARAFTLGTDVFFAADAYDPVGDAGVALIAHEAAHVAQHLGGHATASGRKVSRPDDAHERQADAFAARFRARQVRDPASLVERVRQEGNRASLPFLREFEDHFGIPLDFVELYTGDTARLACELMQAGAFAVRNIIALADPSPQRELLMHELTHIVQMGAGRAPAVFGLGSLGLGEQGSAAEREADRAPARPTVAASPDTIHRNTAKPDEGPTTAEQIKEFFKTFLSKVRFDDFSADDKRKDVKYGVVKTGYLDPRLYRTSAELDGDDYVKGAHNPRAKPDDLKKLHDDFGSELKLSSVNGSAGKYIVYQDTVATHPSKVDLKTVTRGWTKFNRAVTDYGAGSFTWPATPEPGDPRPPSAAMQNRWREIDGAHTDNEEGWYRRATVKALGALDKWQQPGGWAAFHSTIVKAKPRLIDSRTQGEIFGWIVINTAKGQSDARFTNVEKGDPIFDVGLYGLDGSVTAHGDGKAEFKDGSGQILFETKAKNRGPSKDELVQARNYRKILAQKGLAYTWKEEEVTQHEFTHIIYAVADSTPDRKWARAWYTKLFVTGDDLGPIMNTAICSITPSDFKLEDGSAPPEFTFGLNPQFTVPLGAPNDPRTRFRLDDPPIKHPGLTFKQLDVTLGEDRKSMQSGRVVFDVTAGDLTRKHVEKKFTAAPVGSPVMATAPRQLDGLKSSLEKLLGPVSVDAAVVDGGVEASLTVTPQGKGIGGFNVDHVTLKAKYSSAGSLKIAGKVAIKHRNGKIDGLVEMCWSNGGWELLGEIDVKDKMIPGVGPFRCTFEYVDGEVVVGIDTITIEKDFKGIKLRGTGRNLRYDVKRGSFSGEAGLRAELGLFGTATADAVIEDNDLKKVELAYDSPELRYPAGPDRPAALAGTVGGTLTYDSGKFSGRVRGTANLNLPGLKALAGDAGVGLAVNASVSADGAYSGSIRTTTPLRFGKHLEIPSVGLDIKEDGSLEGDFAVKIVKLKWLADKAEVKCKATREGIEIEELKIEKDFGSPDKNQFWGKLEVGYQKASGFLIGGTASYKIREGMVATGQIKYATETHEAKLELTVDEITLLDVTPAPKTLFKATKQIPIVTFAGLGIYVDIGFDLQFKTGFKLGLRPKLDVDGFSLETGQFKSIEAKLELLGNIFAELIGTPMVGLGVFALSPAVLRGGGGLKLPVTGRLDINPTGKIELTYSPDGGVTGDTRFDLSMVFGLKAALKPYAEFNVMSGMWNPTWDGKPLTEFTILEPKELFKLSIDLGGDMTRREAPELPAENTAPPAPDKANDSKFAQREGESREADVTPDKEKQGPTHDVKESGDGGPFSLGGLFQHLRTIPGVATAERLLAMAKKVWKVVEPVYEIFEPLIKVIKDRIESLMGLFETAPESTADLFPWLWKLAKAVFGLSFGGLVEIAEAIVTIVDNAWKFAKKLVNRAVQDGWIGVKRHSYYIYRPIISDIEFMAAAQWKIHIPGVFWDDGGPPGFLLSPSGVTSLVLYEALDHIVDDYTYRGKSDIGEPYNDYWRGEGQRG